MLVEVLNLLTILVGSAETCGVGDVTHRSTCLAHGLDDTSQILIVGAASILGIELNVLDIALGILHRGHGTLDNLLGGAVKLVADVRRAGSDTCMYTFTLGILQCLGSCIDILLYGASECADGGPCYCLTDFDD